MDPVVKVQADKVHNTSNVLLVHRLRTVHLGPKYQF